MSAAARTLSALLTAQSEAERLIMQSTVRDSFDRARFDAAFAAVGRRLGTAPVAADASLSDARGRAWSIAGWGCDEAARALLLLAAIDHVPTAEHAAFVDDCYRAGALRERTAILRTLAVLPEPDRFLPIALDACRTSTQPVFEAIACENPYPAAEFPEPSFNQMVLKAVFTEVALARILDLGTRLGPELSRMAAAYASERRAAGRSVPADLDLLGAR